MQPEPVAPPTETPDPGMQPEPGMPEPTPEPAPPPPPVAQAEMPPAVLQILKANCAACHTYGERDPIGWGSALDVSRMISSDIIVPGRPEESRLHFRVAVKRDMPFGGIAGMPLPAEDAQILVEWIRTLDRPIVKPRTQADILDLIVADQDQNRNGRNNFRYISFAHFVDEKRSPEELK